LERKLAANKQEYNGRNTTKHGGVTCYRALPSAASRVQQSQHFLINTLHQIGTTLQAHEILEPYVVLSDQLDRIPGGYLLKRLIH